LSLKTQAYSDPHLSFRRKKAKKKQKKKSKFGRCFARMGRKSLCLSCPQMSKDARGGHLVGLMRTTTRGCLLFSVLARQKKSPWGNLGTRRPLKFEPLCRVFQIPTCRGWAADISDWPGHVRRELQKASQGATRLAAPIYRSFFSTAQWDGPKDCGPKSHLAFDGAVEEIS